MQNEKGDRRSGGAILTNNAEKSRVPPLKFVLLCGILYLYRYALAQNAAAQHAKRKETAMTDRTESLYLECGRIINTHGCRGGVKAESWADSPADICRLSRLYHRVGDEMRPLTLRRASVMKGQFLLLEFEGVTDMDAANAMRGETLYADRVDMPLKKGQYFLADAEGLPVMDGRPGREGICLGVVVEVASGVASPLLTVDTGRERVLVPAVAAFVREVVPGSHITLTPIDGMFDGEAVVLTDAPSAPSDGEV